MLNHSNVNGTMVKLTPEEEAYMASLVKNFDDNAESRAGAAVRNERDRLLLETDWWTVADRNITAEQTAYRAAVRAITTSKGFPFNITWPKKP